MRSLVIGMLVVGLVGCASVHDPRTVDPRAPRLTEIRFEHDRVTSGCPASLNVRFDRQDQDVVAAVLSLRREHFNHLVETRELRVPVSPRAVGAQRPGEARVDFVADRPGVHRYQVELVDAAGRRSNALKDALVVGGPLPWKGGACS